MGGLSGGHYVAYVITDRYEDLAVSESTKDSGETPENTDTKTIEKRWVYCSDTQVRPASLEEVLKCQAYLVFYEKAAPEEPSEAS
ncbi:hypothetical protein K7432_015648 [Basidiobolus ranarum]|uniref:USP domain-containing protein n=1 Tax=Basidiobolus ranarum TaxID=34480 RepID=A0ABR2VNW7_9FUNG